MLPRRPGRLTRRQRGWLAMALTGVAGSIDVVGYILLVKVLTANMTGNTVALGMGLVDGDMLTAARRGFAIPMFLIGMIWSRVMAHVGQRRGWHHVGSIFFGSEALLLAGFVIAGLAYAPGGHVESDAGASYFLLVALPSLAMGVQNASLSHFGPLSVRTTHITGNLATLADQMARFGIWFFGARTQRGLRGAMRESPRQASFNETVFLTLIWCTYLIGAIIGIALFLMWSIYAVVPAIAVLVALVAVDWANPILAPRASVGPTPKRA